MGSINDAFMHLVVGILVVLALLVAGNGSKRASQPNPANGPVRILSEVAR